MTRKVETALIVDEFEPNVTFWELILKERGIQKIFSVRTSAEGIQTLKNEKIHFLIAGWNLSGTPGYVFVQKIRCNKRWKNIPLIVHSQKLNPDDFQLVRELGIENQVQAPFKREDMMQLVDSMIKNEENKLIPELLCRKIESLLNENKAQEAKDLFNKELLKPGPWQKRAQILLAEIQLFTGEKEEAEQTYKAACALDETYLPAKYALAHYYSVVARHDEALQILNELHKNCPRNFATTLNLSTAFINSDQHENARRTLHKITEVDPENREVDDELGKLALKEGNLALAAKFLAETQNGDEIARFYNMMGISLVSKGMFDKGIETYNSALQVLQQSKAKLHLVTYNLGLALRKKGDLAGSFKAFCDSYLADPSFEKAYNSIAKTAQEIQKSGATVNTEMVKLVKEKRLAYQEALAAKQRQHAAAKKSA